jgi:hypothetical protein
LVIIMHFLFVILVLLGGGTCVILAAAGLFSSKRQTGYKRWLVLVASALLVVGGIGFFGSALSAVGGLNWLPDSFEWPVGYASGIISTQNGLHVVPHTPSGRIQVYDSDWTFIRGWHVDAGGGTFKLAASADSRIDVFTARGEWHYVFSSEGELLSKRTYSPAAYSSFPDEGTSLVVPTPPWLLVFSHPLASWGVAAIGMGILLVADRTRKKRVTPNPSNPGAG